MATTDLQKATGTYMSVDAKAAIERNQNVIEKIRAIVRKQSRSEPVETAISKK